MTISFQGASDQFTLSASSTDARALNEWQFTLMEGPCVDAATSNPRVVETAPSEANPWPRLSAKAHAIGYRSIAGVPLRVGGSTFATLTLQDRHRTITAETISDAETVADEIAPLILTSLRRQSPSLDRPADHDTFHQATGMVMRQVGIGPRAAAAMLREHARADDRLVTDVASDVVTLALDFRRVR